MCSLALHHPSTSFSGATALVTFSVFILWMESKGSCTMRPWTDEFSFTSFMLRRTCKDTVNLQGSLCIHQKSCWLCKRCDLSYLILCGSLGKFHMCGLYSNLCTSEMRLKHKDIIIQSEQAKNIFYVKTYIDNFTSSAAFNFILMYRFESLRSPTCKETIIKRLQNRCDNTKTSTTHSPVRPQDQDWSWGSSPSSAPHPSSDVPSPVWE